MSRAPRGLSADETALWRKVTATVTPLHPQAPEPAPIPPPVPPPAVVAAPPNPVKRVRGRVPPPLPPVPAAPPPKRPLTSEGLDGTWDRKLSSGNIVPDATIDLHGMNLQVAHARLNISIGQALAMGSRVILLIVGKQRPQGERGIIRAQLLDWLAHSPHADRIAAVRAASPRHGGAGAVYIVLRKPR